MDRSKNTGATSSGGDDDKLSKGPCAKQYEWLQTCAAKNQARNPKEQMQSCPSETDRLIKCVHRHPKYFQSS